MAMRLADTFLVHLRSCFAILFSGQTPHWSLPRFFFGTTQPGSIARWIKRMNIEQMFAIIAFTSCKCGCSQ